MGRILVTGATGNIGYDVIRFLFQLQTGHTVIAGVRSIEKAKQVFTSFPELQYSNFDFEDPSTYNASLDDIDTIFLLRPPQISDTEKYFRPLISFIKERGIEKVVFLSVQGAEKSSIIPHNKIEKLIIEYGLSYIFLRPSYFMQNLTTTLLGDIQKRRKIILPAGNAKFNWIDVENIGEVAAMLLCNFEEYRNRAIELTGYENEPFGYAANMISSAVNYKVEYINTNPLRFYGIKKRDGMAAGMIMVMIMLHFLPRFQAEPKISHFYETITGKKPTTLAEFVKREAHRFAKPFSK
jgi:uncharacterized protein YbjT (DUF2867 family)